jgi:hypothetical protein
VDPKTILQAFRHPPGGRLQEVYNSKLGMPYIEATNRLSIQEVLALCGSDGMRINGICGLACQKLVKNKNASERTCACQNALASAVITDKALIPVEIRQRLDLLLDKYIK